ncbi:hypothetical protein A2859_03085 [Candidatus Roizmanbacteria bacterium RIFCSPHIGHO2_01_FULL_37_16b]|nr:MAG: hypothetical protein A2859_03085 [Candidatus Roizmanbacteria bacterium RIFCSPHIGHO2_01_FULL_37_16b]
MNILWFTWKDKKNPAAGGAELINEELAKRLVEEENEVKFLVGGFKGAEQKETIYGYEIIRVGNRFTVYWEAFRYFRKHLNFWPDLIIEEINTFPFFTQLYTKQKRVLLFYQLCREIWFYQFSFPLNLIGYFLESIYLKFLSNNKVITESESTKKDLLKYGFSKENIAIFPIGISPIKSMKLNKFPNFTLLSFGTIRSMKRTTHQIKAFEIAKQHIPKLKLIIVGDSQNHYGKKVLQIIDASPYKKDVSYFGKVDEKRKFYLMAQSHLILVTSVKEGWGLVVTEANSQGTPAIVYDVDGLRDSVEDKVTGLVCKKNNPNELARNIVKLFKEKKLYKRLQNNAFTWSKQFNFDKSYREFKNILKL